jgi:hypothetical protein
MIQIKSWNVVTSLCSPEALSVIFKYETYFVLIAYVTPCH